MANARRPRPKGDHCVARNPSRQRDPKRARDTSVPSLPSGTTVIVQQQASEAESASVAPVSGTDQQGSIGGKPVMEQKGVHIPFALIGVFFALGLNLFHMAYTVGVVLTRVSQVEESAKVSTTKLDAVNSTNIKLATLESTLSAISNQLSRLEGRLDRKSNGAGE